MVEKIGTIRNPLTIIAIFAGIAEISGTAVLPFISDGNQSTYMWFLMLFPLLLIVLFFASLNFNHRVLYAPSDFSNEDNFFRSFQSATPAERADKLRDEVREIEAESLPEQRPAIVEPDQFSPEHLIRRNAQARYLLAEELILNKLSKELGVVRRDVRVSGHGLPVVFDGLAMSDDKVTAIEVKYFRDARLPVHRAKTLVDSISRAVRQLPESMRSRFSLILAVAVDAPSSEHSQLAQRLSDLMKDIPFPVQIRIFNLEDLEKEFNLAG